MSEMVLSFSMRIQLRSGLNVIWMDVHSDLLLDLGLTCQLKFQHIAMNSNISLAAICLTVDIIWFDLCKLERESIK